LNILAWAGADNQQLFSRKTKRTEQWFGYFLIESSINFYKINNISFAGDVNLIVEF